MRAEMIYQNSLYEANFKSIKNEKKFKKNLASIKHFK